LENGFRVKRFPNCGSAHRALDGAARARERHGSGPTTSRPSTCAPRISHLNNLMYTDPQDPLQAKFSLEYGLACAAARDATAGSPIQRRRRPAAPRDARALSPHPPPPVDWPKANFPTEVP
jgi:2-methylcitrate dehydratase PrpD